MSDADVKVEEPPDETAVAAAIESEPQAETVKSEDSAEISAEVAATEATDAPVKAELDDQHSEPTTEGVKEENGQRAEEAAVKADDTNLDSKDSEKEKDS